MSILDERISINLTVKQAAMLARLVGSMNSTSIAYQISKNPSASAAEFVRAVGANSLGMEGGKVHMNIVTSLAAKLSVAIDSNAVYKKLTKCIESNIAVPLNDTYTAVITSDAVKVGCQTFTKEAVLKLAEEVKKSEQL